jgi:hypothetical protein
MAHPFIVCVPFYWIKRMDLERCVISKIFILFTIKISFDIDYLIDTKLL